MSAKFDSPIVLELGTSRDLAIFFLTSHMGGALLVAVLPLPLLWRIVLWVALALGVADALARHAWRRCRGSVVALVIDGDGQHTLRVRSDTTELPFTISARFLHPRLTLFTARVEGYRRQRRIAIPADATDTERFRRWRARVFLQTGAG